MVMVARNNRVGSQRRYLIYWLVTSAPFWLGVVTIFVWAYNIVEEKRSKIHASSSLATLAALPTVPALVHPDGVGKLPALGWNSWNAFKCDIDATKVMTAANQVISLGLKDAGYEYINIDDCWSVKSHRDNVTDRMIPDPDKFPEGIAGIASQVHALGLKFGLYSSAGTETCADYPASIGREYLDAATFAEWGVDYLKYDNCHIPKNWTDEYVFCVPDRPYGLKVTNGTCEVTNTTAPAGYDWSTSNTTIRYRNMRDALLAQNRTILYSICQWGRADVSSWGSAIANSWRMSTDINPYWASVAEILNENSFLLNAVNFWGHSDADMLEVGNGNLTFAETRSHFAFWAAMKSPLIIGTALDKLPSEYVAILANKYLLAFSQDEHYGRPAMPYKWGVNPQWTFNATHPAEYWSGASSQGVLVMMLNSLDQNATRDVKWVEVPQLEKGSHAYQVLDVWTGDDLGCIANGVSRTLESHETAVFLVGEKCTARR